MKLQRRIVFIKLSNSYNHITAVYMNMNCIKINIYIMQTKVELLMWMTKIDYVYTLYVVLYF